MIIVNKKSIIACLISIITATSLATESYAKDRVPTFEYSVKYNGEKQVKLRNAPYQNSYNGRVFFPVLEIFKLIDPESKQVEVKTDNVFINSEYAYLISFKNACYEMGEGASNIKVYDKTCTKPTGNTVSILYGPSVESNEPPIVYAPLEFFEKVLGEGTEIKTDTMIDHDYKLNIRTLDYKKFLKNNNRVILLKVNDPWMYVNDEVKLLDSEQKSTPVIRGGRTLLPIANIIKELGGSIKWEGKERKLTIILDNNNIDLWIDTRKAVVNGIEKTLDTPPTIIAGKTMLPLRFVSDNLGLKLEWDGKNGIAAIYRGDFEYILKDYNTYFSYEDSIQKEVNNGNTNGSAVQNDKVVNNNKPIDRNGVAIQVGDRVRFSFFYGEVQKIDGGRILVYWDSKNSVWVTDEDADYWAMLAGIRYKSSSWIDAKDLSVEH